MNVEFLTTWISATFLGMTALWLCCRRTAHSLISRLSASIDIYNGVVYSSTSHQYGHRCRKPQALVYIAKKAVWCETFWKIDCIVGRQSNEPVVVSTGGSRSRLLGRSANADVGHRSKQRQKKRQGRRRLYVPIVTFLQIVVLFCNDPFVLPVAVTASLDFKRIRNFDHD